MSKIIRKYNRFNLTKKELKKEYDELGNCKKIGEKFGFCDTTVRKWMKKYEIPLRTTWTRGGHNILPLQGQRFGKLVVLEKAERRDGDNSSARWLCQCDCGNQIVVISRSLRKELTKSCGCLRVKRNAPNAYKGLSHAYWSRIVKGAKLRSFNLEITPKQAWNKFLDQGKKCALSGEKIELTNPYHCKSQTASFDRIDSSKGYIADNIQWVHKRVNIMKGNLDEQEFINWCKKIYELSRY